MEKEKSSSRKHKESRHRERESSPKDVHKHRQEISDDEDDYYRRHHNRRSARHREDSDGDERHRSDDRHRRSSREYSVERERSSEPSSDGDGSRERSHDRGRRERSYEREKSYDRERREKSYDRDRREKSYEREDLVDRKHHTSSRSHKRKERAESEDRSDGGEKRARVLEEKKERRRRFEDRVEEDNGKSREEKKEKRRFEDGDVKAAREERREKRRFEDSKVKEEEEQVTEVDEGRKERGFDERSVKKEPKDEPIDKDRNGTGSAANGAAVVPVSMTSRTSPETSIAASHPSATKVSSISTTNENKGVNINRSHEVPGKSSTDGTVSDAGKSGGFSLDALAKAKRALQMKKQLAEKLKKIPSLNKVAEPVRESSPQVGSSEGIKAPPSAAGILPTPGLSATASVSVPAGTAASTSMLPSAAASLNAPPSGLPHLPGLTAQKYEAIRRAQELAAKMGFRQDPQFAPLINMFPGQMPPEVTVQPKPAKAPVLRLDALGREIDEHGNVVEPKVNSLSTLKVNINKKKKEAFQILKPELEVDPEKNPHFDARMGINKDKLLRPKRMTFQFVEEGKWAKEADMMKLKNQFGEARAKELKAKQAQLAKAKAEPDINPNLIEVSERVIAKEKPKEQIPEIEWWDAPFLRNGTYDGIVDGDLTEDMLKMDKITIYVEHPRPIEPPAEPAPPPPQPLKLTKKEQKKLRTQRRLGREKERQEMIRQGLIEPPKPKVKMSNLMKVLGSEATQDPTKLEMEIKSAAAEREQAHMDRNIARKLTPAERREKKERKLFDDPNAQETIVSVYKINDLSHPQTRFKVDINAQENRLTGCAVISEGITVVVVEGGNKSIKRYKKLMLRRIDWAAAVKTEEDQDEDEDKPVNKCLLVWQGSVVKPTFNRFTVHDCRTEAAARKVFADAGVAHYWELAVNFSEDEI